MLPELNVKNDQEAQKCYKHVLDLFDLSIYRLFEFKHIILARGYRGSDPLVDFCRAFMTAALKNIELAIPIAFALINHGCRFTPENKAIYQEMKIKYRTLLRYALFFQFEDGAGFRYRGAQILPQDRSAAEVSHIASILCSRGQMALPV